jgi:hypothetical protein
MNDAMCAVASAAFITNFTVGGEIGCIIYKMLHKSDGRGLQWRLCIRRGVE